MVRFSTFSAFFISVLLYCTALVSTVFFISQYMQKSTKYTDTKDAFIDVYVLNDIGDVATLKTAKPKPGQVEQPAEIIKRDDNKTINKKENLKNLFDDIKIPTVKQPAKKQVKEKPNIINKANAIISSLEKNGESSNAKHRSTGVYNKYYGTITNIMQTKWGQFFTARRDDMAVVRLYISKSMFSYEILKLSLNSDFNQNVRNFMDSLSLSDFPPPPASAKGTIVIKVNLEGRLQ